MMSEKRIPLANKRKIFAVAGVITAVVGAGTYAMRNDEPVQPAATPTEYNITTMGCDVPKALQTAQKAINLGKPLTANVIRPNTEAVDSVLEAYNKEGFQAVNPLVVVCNGVVKRAIGVDRGFYGDGRARLVAEPAPDLTYAEELDGNRHNTIAYSDVSRYVNTDTLIDNGPVKAGVSGLSSQNFAATSYAFMP